MTDLFLTFLVSLLGGVIGSLAHKWGLERKTSQLEIELFDLKERLLIEIKKRASAAGRRAQQFDEDALAAAKTAQPAQPPAFWWQPFVKSENRG